MKKDGTIPARITDFAKALKKQVDAAADRNPSIDRVDWPHIKNMLPRWDLWPASKIKV
jgi:ActR/RegA family two-component response regulator